MADPLGCLRVAAIIIGFWNILYCLIQMGVLGWQVKVVKDLQAYWENRDVADNVYTYQNFKARFPGVYELYTETPEKRRINAMYAIVLICIVLAIIHLPFTILMLYGAIKRRKNFIWPWFFSAVALIIMSTAYAVLWWSGDVFTEQLVMSVAEFVMSIAISGPGFCAVVFYYIRLTGSLTSTRPASRRGRKSHRATGDIPPWRTEWPERPPKELERKLRRKSRDRREKDERKWQREAERLEKEKRRMERDRRQEDDDRRREYRQFPSGNFDYYVPGTVDAVFPWNVPVQRPPPPSVMERPRKKTAAEVIENLYYEHYPDDVPGQNRERIRSVLQK